MPSPRCRGRRGHSKGGRDRLTARPPFLETKPTMLQPGMSPSWQALNKISTPRASSGATSSPFEEPIAQAQLLAHAIDRAAGAAFLDRVHDGHQQARPAIRFHHLDRQPRASNDRRSCTNAMPTIACLHIGKRAARASSIVLT